jgi:MFS family permease
MAEALKAARGHATNRWVVLTLVCIAQFMVVLDATIVNVALPSIQKSLHLSPSDLQWVVNAYTLMFGGFLLLGGRMADLMGRKKLFLAGLTVFTIASLLDGLAQSSEFLIFARGLQGLGAALVSPAALSVIMTTFEEGEERTKALGVWSGIAAGGAAVGLLAGGVLTELLDWRWIFFVNVPIGIATFAASLRWVPESKVDVEHRSYDIFGAVTVTAGLITLVYGIIKSTQWHWTGSDASKTWITLGIAAVLLVANVSMLLTACGLFAMFFFNSLYIQEVLGYSAIRAGFAFLPVAITIGIGAGLAGVAVKRFGVRLAGVIGLTIATIGMFLIAGPGSSALGIELHDPTYLQNVFPGLVVMALGMGMTFVPLTLVATTGIEAEDAGLASGLFNTSQQIGGAIGLAVLTTVSVNGMNDSLAKVAGKPTPAQLLAAAVDGWTNAFIGGACFLLAALVLLVVFLRPHHVKDVSTDPAQAMVAG